MAVWHLAGATVNHSLQDPPIAKSGPTASRMAHQITTDMNFHVPTQVITVLTTTSTPKEPDSYQVD